MSAEESGRPVGDKVSTAVSVAAIVVSILVMAALASTDVHVARRVHESRILATIVPASGALQGQKLDGSKWAPPDNEGRIVVLFGTAEPGRVGDVAFWSDIAARTHAAAVRTQFVGLCTAALKCTLPASSGDLFALLEFMDPLQTHALATAARQKRAFVYRGSQILGSLSIMENPQKVAEEIAKISLKNTKEGGA